MLLNFTVGSVEILQIKDSARSIRCQSRNGTKGMEIATNKINYFIVHEDTHPYA